MLTAYAHPSCKAILFRTRKALRNAAATLSEFDTSSLGVEFLRKAAVLYPAEQPLLIEQVKSKWKATKSLRVLFCGRHYHAKNGQLALNVMKRLSNRYLDCEFTYIGDVPPEELKPILPLPKNLMYLGNRCRADVLRYMADSHILFHPARSESFGMVFIEAAAAALAIVCAAGRRTYHVSEFLGSDGLATVNLETIASEDVERGFEQALDSLLGCPRQTESMAMSNYAQANEGVISLDKRNRRLTEIYRRAAEEPVEAFRLSDLPYRSAANVVEMSDAALTAAEVEFRRDTGQSLTARNIYF